MTELVLQAETVEETTTQLRVNIYVNSTPVHSFLPGTDDEGEAIAKTEEILASALGRLLQER